MRGTVGLLLGTMAVTCAATVANSDWDPNFTPVHFVNQSDLIAIVKLGKPDDKGKVTATIVETLKGKPKDKTITFDFSTAVPDAKTVAFIHLSAHGDAPAVFLTGAYKERDGDERRTYAYLHVQTVFLVFEPSEREGWESGIRAVASWNFDGPWWGGTDMFIRCIRYVLSDPEAYVASWPRVIFKKQTKIATFPGIVRSLAAVDLAGDGRLTLHAACDTGDRLLLYEAGDRPFKDVTAERGLASQSQEAIWADFNADGRLDLASWNGSALTLYLQGADGTFKAQPVKVDLKDGCRGLAVLDVDAKGRPGLLVSTRGAPVLLMPDKDGTLVRQVFPALPKFEKPPRQAGPCLVADFDGDQLADVVQVFTLTLVFYKGRGGGGFHPPKMAGDVSQDWGGAESQGGPGRPCTGDFDQDGMLDICTTGEVGCSILQNLGGGRFEDRSQESGPFSYQPKPDTLSAQVADFDNDGHAGLLVTHADFEPQAFYNRGFRSLHRWLLYVTKETKHLHDGQQAGLATDLNGDGLQDIVLVDLRRTAWVFYGEALAPASATRPWDWEPTDATRFPVVRVALPLGGPYCGPLTVTGWAGARCLGAWNVVAGSQEATFARGGPGPIELRWQFPGHPAQKRTVRVEGKPQRVVLEPEP